MTVIQHSESRGRRSWRPAWAKCVNLCSSVLTTRSALAPVSPTVETGSQPHPHLLLLPLGPAPAVNAQERPGLYKLLAQEGDSWFEQEMAGLLTLKPVHKVQRPRY